MSVAYERQQAMPIMYTMRQKTFSISCDFVSENGNYRLLFLTAVPFRFVSCSNHSVPFGTGRGVSPFSSKEASLAGAHSPCKTRFRTLTAPPHDKEKPWEAFC